MCLSVIKVNSDLLESRLYRLYKSLVIGQGKKKIIDQ